MADKENSARLDDQAKAWLDNDYTGAMDAQAMRFGPAEMLEAFKAGWSQRSFAAPDPSEPGPYGIGSDHWPGVGKTLEEMSELGVELGKLMGSGGDRNHWTGDLVTRIRGEMADAHAALDFMSEANPILTDEEHTGTTMSGHQFMVARYKWKLALFRSWQRGDAEVDWPQPEFFGLPPRGKQ